MLINKFLNQKKKKKMTIILTLKSTIKFYRYDHFLPAAAINKHFLFHYYFRSAFFGALFGYFKFVNNIIKVKLRSKQWSYKEGIIERTKIIYIYIYYTLFEYIVFCDLIIMFSLFTTNLNSLLKLFFYLLMIIYYLKLVVKNIIKITFLYQNTD